MLVPLPGGWFLGGYLPASCAARAKSVWIISNAAACLFEKVELLHCHQPHFLSFPLCWRRDVFPSSSTLP